MVREMPAAGVLPNLVSWNTLLGAHADVGDVDGTFRRAAASHLSLDTFRQFHIPLFTSIVGTLFD